MLDKQTREQCGARTWWGTTVILSGLYSKFQASLGYMVLHLKNKIKKKSSSENFLNSLEVLVSKVMTTEKFLKTCT